MFESLSEFTFGKHYRQSTVWPEAHGFEIRRGRVGVLLLHAYFGTPWEMRPLAEYLAALGVSVVCPRITGHGSMPEDIYHISATAWLDDAQAAYHRLESFTDVQVIIGHCIGARLGLALILKRGIKPTGVITVSIPVLPAAEKPFLPGILKWIPKWLIPQSLPIFGIANLIPMRRFEIRLHSTTPWLCYKQYRPTNAYEVGFELRREVFNKLPAIHCPILFVHAKHDHLYSLKHARHGYSAVTSTDKDIYVVDAMTHLLLTNVKKAGPLFRRIYRFIQHCNALPSQAAPIPDVLHPIEPQAMASMT